MIFFKRLPLAAKFSDMGVRVVVCCLKDKLPIRVFFAKSQDHPDVRPRCLENAFGNEDGLKSSNHITIELP